MISTSKEGKYPPSEERIHCFLTSASHPFLMTAGNCLDILSLPATLPGTKHYRPVIENYLKRWSSASVNVRKNCIRVRNDIVEWLKIRPNSSCVGSRTVHVLL